MSRRRRQLARIEAARGASELAAMTLDDLVRELARIELGSDEPFLTVLLPATCGPAGMSPEEYERSLDRAFRERDEAGLAALIRRSCERGNWTAVVTALDQMVAHRHLGAEQERTG